MIDGERPLLPEILSQNDRVGAKSPISDLYSLVARSMEVYDTYGVLSKSEVNSIVGCSACTMSS